METGGGIAGSSLQVEGSSGQRRKFPQVRTEDSAVKRSKLVLSFGRVA
jgi:hypothetical protein